MTFIKLPKRATDITGQRFSRLTVLGPVARDARRQIKWLCQCDCGGTAITTISMLRSGHTKSCGCRSRELTVQRSKTHGMCSSNVYAVWRAMIDRCTLPRNCNYPNYGDRGISICSEWKEDFQAFYEYVSQLPGFGVKGITLDRCDTNGNYEPGNMRWATIQQQARNRRNNFLITYQGKTQCLQAWADEVGIGRRTIAARLKRGWSVEDALTESVGEAAARHLAGNKG